MFQIKIVPCLLYVVALWAFTPGSALTVHELTQQHSRDVIRQTKSEEIRRYLNESADPCEDFYEFTCGNFATHNPTNLVDTPAVNLFMVLLEKNTAKIKNLLETEDAADSDVDRKVKKFYKSCFNIPSSDSLKATLEEFGPMPVLQGDQWQANNFDWAKTFAEIIHKSGMEFLISLEVETDLDDASINRIYMGDPTLLLGHRSNYLEASGSVARENLVDYIVSHLLFLGVNEKLAEQAANEIKDFEIALAHGITDEKLGLTTKQRYALTDIDQLQRKYGDFVDFKKLLNDSLGLSPSALYVHNQYVENALKAVRSTPKRVVANYMYFQYLNNYFIHLSPDPRAMDNVCMKTIKKYFNRNLENMLYRKYIDKDTEQAIYNVWNEFKQVFENTLQAPRLSWIAESTRLEALNKLASMKMFINSYENVNFQQEFDQLDFKDKDWTHNVQSLLRMHGERLRAKFNKPPQPKDFGSLGSFTPVYVPKDNTLYLPVGMLQPFYLWSNAYPNAFNFANLGFFIAHELTHGFDDLGGKYDSKGHERSWWDSNSEKIFRDRTQCFRNQYKQYIYGGIQLPETPLQAENIADNGGIRLAYETYLSWYGKTEEAHGDLQSESFPGLTFNHRQLFFISYSHMWCAAVHPQLIPVQIARDIHTPEKFRVIGSLSNLDEFSEAFSCPSGTGMNPKNKCVIY